MHLMQKSTSAYLQHKQNKNINGYTNLLTTKTQKTKQWYFMLCNPSNNHKSKSMPGSEERH